MQGANFATSTKSATGNATPPAGINTYDEYGNQTSNPQNIGTNQNYGWAGSAHRTTDKNGLILLGARVYNPTTGQFTSTDPVPGANENGFTDPTNPTNYSDTNGLGPCDTPALGNANQQSSNPFCPPLPGRAKPVATLLGLYDDVSNYFHDDKFITLNLPLKGNSKYNWNRNKTMILSSIKKGIPVVFLNNPATVRYKNGNTYLKEIKLIKSLGLTIVPSSGNLYFLNRAKVWAVVQAR